MSVRRLARTEDLSDSAVTAAKIGKSFGTAATLSIDASGTYVVPAGIYMVVADDAQIILEISTDGGSTWYGVAPPSGLVVSDGVNVRLRNTDGAAAHNAYLLPLA